MKIKTREERIELFNGQENLRLLHISDVHVWFSSRILDELKQIILETEPELIILTGDYFDFPKGAHLFRAFMKEIAETLPVVFITGNHDVLWGKKVFNLLLGVPNCHHAVDGIYTFVSKKGNKFNIGSWETRNYLGANNQEKNILLIHSPEKLKVNELKNINLVLAGHLHGGQFILYTRNNSHYPASFVFKHCSDRKQLNGTTLIVSKGAGDTFPIRFNCPKEVILITIS